MSIKVFTGTSTWASLAWKAILAATVALSALGWLTPEQVATLQAALGELAVALPTAVAAVATAVAILRSIKRGSDADKLEG